MKAMFLLPIFMFIAIVSYSQTPNQYPPYPYYPLEPSTFSWGDRYYEKNLDGIKFLMKDIQTLDPSLYQNLQEDYDELLKRDRNSKAILWGGTVVGSAMMIGSLIPILNNNNSSTNLPLRNALNFNTPDQPKIIWGLLGGGLLVSSVSVVVYSKKMIKHRDILNFSNQFNQNSEGDKIEFSLNPVIQFGERTTAGFSLAMLF